MLAPAYPVSNPHAFAAAVSVIICAYTLKRWSEIERAVASAMAQTPAVHEVIVVVDHNPELFARLRARFHDAKIVENAGPQGLSGARNTGIVASTGRLLAFLDDDAEADADCFEIMRRALWREHVLGVSGSVAPNWQSGRPAWFPDEFLWVVGCNEFRLSEGPVRNLIGAAMMLKREVFDTVGGFNSALGRSRSALPMGGEETELCIRATEAIEGGEFRVEPAARANHAVTIERCTFGYFTRRCLAEGLSKATLTAISGASNGLSQERVAAFKTMPAGVFRGVRDGILRRDRSGFARAAAICIGLGCTVAGFLYGRSQIFADRLRVRRPHVSERVGDEG